MSSPIERAAALTVGTVESVSPSEITVLLNTDAPQATALNTGTPTGFPRINGHVLIPNETGAVVGLVVWIGIERSVFPKRTGLKDFGLIDLPFPLRKLRLTPLGTLKANPDADRCPSGYELERGVSAFPSVGDPVHLPTADQLRGIIEACEGSGRRVRIGTSPLAAHIPVTVDPDKLFGRHLAVLGNTGSGKSCSVAGLVRWCIATARTAMPANQKRGADKHEPANARFIILDPNGEYATAFHGFRQLRLFQVVPSSPDDRQFVLPAWMWNSEEWCAFAQAAPQVQRPILIRALSGVRCAQPGFPGRAATTAGVLADYRRWCDTVISQGVSAQADFRIRNMCGGQLGALARDARAGLPAAAGAADRLRALADRTEDLLREHVSDPGKGYYQAFSMVELTQVRGLLDECLQHLPSAAPRLAVAADAPRAFDLEGFPDYLSMIAALQDSGGQTEQFTRTLAMRIRAMLDDTRLAPVVAPPGAPVDLGSWLCDYVGDDNARGGEVAVVDLSLVPLDLLHMVVAVLGRVVFESLQRYRRLNTCELPTVLVLEEAHTFVRATRGEETGIATPAQMCRATFERIAREGRKFGLGLVLSSQRPSELSPTALAQCNTFLLHRIVNDRDQDLVGRLVPDNLGGLLKELPSLPTRHAILLGWAAAVPTLVEIDELPMEQRPRSDDPHFWEVWTGEEQRSIDWARLVADWTGFTPGDQSVDAQDEAGEDADRVGEHEGTRADGGRGPATDESLDPDDPFSDQ